MGLPSPQQMQELMALLPTINTHSTDNKKAKKAGVHLGGLPWYKDAYKQLTGSSYNLFDNSKVKKAVQFGGKAGAAKGATALAAHAGVAGGGVSLVPYVVTVGAFGAVLAPWIGVVAVAAQAGKIFDLHDLLDDAKRGGSSKTGYVCTCGKCKDNLKYVIDKKDRNVALLAAGVFTGGAVSIGKKIHSAGKKLFSSGPRPKEMVSRTLCESARYGCTCAAATVFMLSGSWSFIRNPDRDTLATAVATIISEDGWEKLKGNW